MKRVELVAPAGGMDRLRTAFAFGADAAYFGGKEFSLRAFCENFDEAGLKEAVEYAHRLGKKAYVTLNIFARNADFGAMREMMAELERIGADAVIASDPGVLAELRRVAPKLGAHLSTQANTLNKHAAKFWAEEGVKRIILARELSLDEIREIRDFVGDSIELEAFAHGAMCVAYSGRCLLSSWLTGRDGNRGECAQPCRWRYLMREENSVGNLTLEEDERGGYVLNSRDLNAMPILDRVISTGIDALKIEGRMKSKYYVGTAVNAYRRRIDDYCAGRGYDPRLNEELEKVAHREYTTGFYLGEPGQCSETDLPPNEYRYVADVLGYDAERGMLRVAQRNRFAEGDALEAITRRNVVELIAEEIYDADGNRVPDCKRVMQELWIKTDAVLDEFDMLRRKNPK